MDESDFSGLDFAAAKVYPGICRRYKALRQEHCRRRERTELWSSRAKLAEDKGLADLAAAAQAKADDAAARLAALQGEREELKPKVARMRQQLPSIRARERSIDPDRLLAELQIMTGELSATPRTGLRAPGVEREIAKLAAETAADAALAALKKKMDPRDRGSESDPSRRK